MLGVSGLTFIEVLVTALLLALVVAGLLPMLTSGDTTWQHARRSTAMVQNGRLALDRLVREMRAAQTFETISSTLIRFTLFSGQGTLSPSWWNASWACRRQIPVTTGAASAPSGYSIPLTFDHAAYASSGRALSSGNDLRVVRWNGSSWAELDRVLDPQSAWNQATTKIWFRTQAAINANSTDNNYYLYYCNAAAGAPPANEANAFHFADFFNRANSDTVGSGWTVTESTGDIDINGNALFFNVTGDLYNRPLADNTFTGVTDRLVWRFGFNWARTGAETTYRLHMQLGRNGSMANPPTETNFWSNAGIGPSMLWASPDQGMINHEAFGTAVGTTVTERQVISGAAHIQIIANVGTDTYDLYINDALVVSGVAFSTALGRLDRLRLLSWNISEANFVSCRCFDYTYVRLYVNPEPVASLSGEETNSPTLTVEYQLNAVTNELEYRWVPNAFQPFAGPFRSMSVVCFDASGASISCSSASSVRSVQVSLVAMDPSGIVPDITLTTRAFRQVP